jgi:hypothetical protein
MSAPLPALVDRKTLARETGLPRSTIDHLFGRLPVVAFEGHRKVFVRRADVERLIAENTYDKGRVRP